MSEHAVINEAQPIADQIMVKCSCGWRRAVSLYDFDDRKKLWNEVDRIGREHVTNPPE